MRVALLPGDGIGREIIPEAVKVLQALRGVSITFEEAPVAGAGVDAFDDPLPPSTLELCRKSDAVLFGAAGAPKYEGLPRSKRPGLGLLKLRKALQCYANLRPVKLFPELANASTLKPEAIDGLDLLIVRELNGDIYYGEPRGRIDNTPGRREAINTMRYTEDQIARVAHVAFKAARARRGKLCSMDKQNVLETMVLWREVVTEVGREYPDVELTHQLVDSGAMMLVRAPTKFDVILTGNMFGDILSDQASMLTGSLGMLPSAALGDGPPGLYEPIHGSAPDIAGKDIANPLGTILSAAMMLRYSLNLPEEADRVEAAVRRTLAAGLRTADIQEPGTKIVGTRAMGDAVAAALQ